MYKTYKIKIFIIPYFVTNFMITTNIIPNIVKVEDVLNFLIYIILIINSLILQILINHQVNINFWIKMKW